MKSLLYC